MAVNYKVGRLVWRGREVTVLAGQVRIYARKSVSSETAERSIEEQVAHAIAQCERMGLPVLEADRVEERPGHGGDEFWIGGGSSDREVDGKKKRFRPKLTELVRDVRAGLVKVVVVWDMTRLWRSVELCGALVELFLQHGVLLIDRNGHVDIESPEGRQMVNFLAAAAQHHREMCRAHSMRAVQAKRERGEAANAVRGLGYVSLPGQGIVHIPEEIALARRIVDLFIEGVRGEDGVLMGGPLSPLQIAELLTAEGCTAFHNTSKAPVKPDAEPIVWRPAIDRVLRNPRYIGKQRHGRNGLLYEAKEFLIDGKPAIDPAVWQRVQDKLDRNSTIGRRRVSGPPLSGWLRCGSCAKTYGHQDQTWKSDGDPIVKDVWRLRAHHSYHECDHLSSSFDMDKIHDFIREHLTPLLLIEMREQRRASMGSATENKLAELRMKREEAVEKQKVQLPKLLREHWENNPALVAQLSRILEDDLAQIDGEILRLELRARHLEAEVDALEGVSTLDESQMRDLVRTVVKWVAVVPDVNPRGKRKRTLRGVSPRSGRLLFLTAWGTYHTAVYELKRLYKRTKQKVNVLRPAEPSEVLGSVMDLPEPQRFYENLRRERTHASRGVFSADEWAPGYAAEAHEAEIIELPFVRRTLKEAA